MRRQYLKRWGMVLSQDIRESISFESFPYFNAPHGAIGKMSGRSCIIIGSSCFARLEGLKAIQIESASGRPVDVCSINDSSVITGIKPDHMVSLHWDRIPKWYEIMRWLYGWGDAGILFHSTKKTNGVDAAWGFSKLGGGSAGLAAMIMLHLGYDTITLAGCPMDDTPRATNAIAGVDHPSDKYNDCLSFFRAHAEVMHQLGVRSMSGETAALLNIS
jgi:hypothetical protein